MIGSHLLLLHQSVGSSCHLQTQLHLNLQGIRGKPAGPIRWLNSLPSPWGALEHPLFPTLLFPRQMLGVPSFDHPSKWFNITQCICTQYSKSVCHSTVRQIILRLEITWILHTKIRYRQLTLKRGQTWEHMTKFEKY